MLTDSGLGLAVEFGQHRLGKPECVGLEAALYSHFTVFALEEEYFTTGWLVGVVSHGGHNCFQLGYLYSSGLTLRLPVSSCCIRAFFSFLSEAKANCIFTMLFSDLAIV